MHAELNSTEIQQKEQLARFLWVSFILLFFAIQAIIWTIAILMTSNDPSHAVVRDFDTRSALPPSRAERTGFNRALGWATSLKVRLAPAHPSSPGQRHAEVELSLKNKNGLPIELPCVDLSVFHCAWAANVQQIKLHPQQPGVYRGEMRVDHSGQWQFDGNISHENAIYYLNERVSL